MSSRSLMSLRENRAANYAGRAPTVRERGVAGYPLPDGRGSDGFVLREGLVLLRKR